MGASKWRVYNEAKQKIANGTVDLDANTLRMALFKSGGNVTTLTLSTYASLTTKVSGSSGYTGNKTLTTSMIVGANASTYKFKFASVVFTASNANIASIKYAVIYVSGGACICFCSLSTAVFAVTQNNTLTIAADATGGAFTIGGGTATS